MATAPEHLDVPPAIVFRAMAEGDVSQVLAIERAAYAFPWSEGIFRDCVRVGYTCRAVELAGELIGYGILSAGAGEAHILNICVREEFRCRGVGRRLLEHLMALAREEGMSEVFLEVRPSNTAAIRLYQSLGFRQIGMRRGYYQASGGREDAVVLKCALEHLHC
ncbi:MAG: ribosomal protein S18-alanine N-acetyltransferase [Gammaproteobacteria bacterium]|nr:ribosomal protein S18-alanine N-acetyltransferase [Gammaproteobacteria bacterium]